MSREDALNAMFARVKGDADMISQTNLERSPSQLIEVGEIRPSPFQARRDFTGIQELTEDVKKHGVLQPILVRLSDNGTTKYELVAGERRWRAAQAAGRRDIPAVIRENMTDKEAREIGLTENLRRSDLNTYELTKAIIDMLVLKTGLSADEVVVAIKKQRPDLDVIKATDEVLKITGTKINFRSFVRHYVDTLFLPPHLIEAIEQGASYLAVKAIKNEPHEKQLEWLPRIVSGEWSVREVKKEIAAQKKATVEPESPIRGGTTESAEWIPRLRSLSDRAALEKLETLDGRTRRKVDRLVRDLSKLLGVNQDDADHAEEDEAEQLD